MRECTFNVAAAATPVARMAIEGSLLPGSRSAPRSVLAPNGLVQKARAATSSREGTLLWVTISTEYLLPSGKVLFGNRNGGFCSTPSSPNLRRASL